MELDILNFLKSSQSLASPEAPTYTFLNQKPQMRAGARMPMRTRSPAFPAKSPNRQRAPRHLQRGAKQMANSFARIQIRFIGPVSADPVGVRDAV